MNPSVPAVTENVVLAAGFPALVELYGGPPLTQRTRAGFVVLMTRSNFMDPAPSMLSVVIRVAVEVLATLLVLEKVGVYPRCPVLVLKSSNTTLAEARLENTTSRASAGI